MTQENVETGKTRPVQCKTAHRPSAAPTHIEYPHIEAPGAGTVPAAPPAAQKKGSKLGFLGKALGLGAAAGAVGTGIAVVAGVCDIGDITEAAAEA